MKKCAGNLPKLFVTTLFWLVSVISFAQNLSDIQKQEVEKYKNILEKYKTENNQNMTVSTLAKLGHIYWNANLFADAIPYFSEALTISEKLGNKNGLLTITNYLGALYSDINKYSEAITYYEKNLVYSKQLNNKENSVSAQLNIAQALQNKGSIKESIPYLNEALTGSLELQHYPLIRKSYVLLYQCYEKLGDQEKYGQYFEKYRDIDKLIKDKEMKQREEEAKIKVINAQIEKAQKEKELAEKSSKLKDTEYSLKITEEQNRQKQIEIQLLNQEKELNELQAKQKDAQLKSERYIRYLLIGGVIFVFLIALLILRQFQEKKKANRILEKINIELAEKNVKIEEQYRELKEKNRQIEEQRADLFKKNIQITDSINYASKIQHAILPSQHALAASFPNSFIYYMPRDIVSGDFYWFSKHQEKHFIAAVDCTGHSVPGAFMSMIGNTLLNEIVNEKKIFNPAEILEKLNAGIITTLNQSQQNGATQDDGMDMTLCCFDLKENIVTIAAANHYVFVLNHKQQFEIIEGDIFSIGGHLSVYKDMHFTNHERKLIAGDTFYMFSDGYADQFGGPGGKKFMSERFRNLLLSNQYLSMREQYTLLHNTFEEWRGNTKQIDDVLVIGIRV